jgi:hypothetical protein
MRAGRKGGVFAPAKVNISINPRFLEVVGLPLIKLIL